jgi:hypothetical protein
MANEGGKLTLVGKAWKALALGVRKLEREAAPGEVSLISGA